MKILKQFMALWCKKVYALFLILYFLIIFWHQTCSWCQTCEEVWHLYISVWTPLITYERASSYLCPFAQSAREPHTEISYDLHFDRWAALNYYSWIPYKEIRYVAIIPHRTTICHCYNDDLPLLLDIAVSENEVLQYIICMFCHIWMYCMF